VEWRADSAGLTEDVCDGRDLERRADDKDQVDLLPILDECTLKAVRELLTEERDVRLRAVRVAVRS
jgi:hypothetical protein